MKDILLAAVFCLLAIVGRAAQNDSETVPRPPQSFCGFTFGEVYTNALHVSLAKPFRYCTKANISKTLNEQRIFKVSINGTTAESMSDEDAHTEFLRMCEVVGAKFGVKMERHGRGLSEAFGHSDKTFSINAKYGRAKKGSVVFSVTVVRKDILEADKSAAKKGALPLPSGVGAESL